MKMRRLNFNALVALKFVNDYPNFKTLLFITLFRFISVYGLTFILNKVRLEPIGKVDQAGFQIDTFNLAFNWLNRFDRTSAI